MLVTMVMEKIDPQADHEKLNLYGPGQEVLFQGKSYRVQRRTTLASGEAAIVLQNESEQFVLSANQFFAGVQTSR